MGLSIRAYGRHRGVSDTAVRKAIKAGRITPEPDGTLDPDKADAQWAANTDTAQQRQSQAQRAVPNEAINMVRETTGEGALPSGGTTLLQARTANEVLKAQTAKVRLARLKAEVVDRAKALAHVFKLARAERDAWLNWPSRISSQMAAELNIDAHTLHVLLEREVRHHLEELGDPALRVD
ncbi:MAG: elements of external origin [Cellvibrionaceae bacterium]|nr:elements of external origin [Cellvibrionaceae bacterium]